MSSRINEGREAAAEYVRAYSAHVTEMREGLRIPKPRPPAVQEVLFPENLSKLGEEELSRQLSYWSSLAGYTNFKVSVLEGAALQATLDYEQEMALRYFHCTKFDKIADKKNYVQAIDAIRTRRLRATRIKADLLVLKSLFVASDLKFRAVSREISRRQGDGNRSSHG